MEVTGPRTPTARVFLFKHEYFFHLLGQFFGKRIRASESESTDS